MTIQLKIPLMDSINLKDAVFQSNILENSINVCIHYCFKIRISCTSNDYKNDKVQGKFQAF